MKKLIVKTIALTVSIMLVLGAGFYLVLSSFFPSVLANRYFDAGNIELALKYSEKAYQQNEDIDSLSILSERSIVFDNDQMIITYCTLLINHDNYQELVLSKSSGYHYYIVSSLCESLYKGGDKTIAIDTAFLNTSDYVEFNPVHKLIVLSASKNDVATLNIIKQKLTERQDKNNLLQSHLALIEQLTK